jgi:hypothetical protein
MSDDPGTQIQVILSDMFLGGRVYTNFYSHRRKQSYKSNVYQLHEWEHQVDKLTAKPGRPSKGF